VPVQLLTVGADTCTNSLFYRSGTLIDTSFNQPWSPKMKMLPSITALTLTCAIALAAGCASTPSQSSTGEVIDDSVITTKVKTAIFNDPILKTAEISVETVKGVVQLSGFVSDPKEVAQAGKVARSVGGVSSVKNDLVKK
jgi:hypothetical protein